MDENNTITPLQSQTIRAALTAIAVNAVALLTMATGKVFDITQIQHAIDAGVPLAINAISIYYGIKAYRGRMNATAIIKKE